MTARAQAAGIKPVSYAVVVNHLKNKSTFTLGPFRSEAKADGVAKSVGGGFTAWVDPLYGEADVAKILQLEAKE